MIVQSLTLCNWGPYRGALTISFDEQVYAVVARTETDPGRSNWQGKTWLLNAVRFALFGDHTATTEDSWITDGEESGSVALTLDDGTTIVRQRRRGRSTQLSVNIKGGENTAKQRQAQDLINEYIGMDAADFTASCFIGQKQIARFITASPAERTEIVNGWLDLGPLQRAEEIAKGRLSEAMKQHAELERRIEVLDRMKAETGDRDEIGEKIEIRKKQIDIAEKQRLEAQRRLDEVTEWKERHRDSLEFNRLVERGTVLKADQEKQTTSAELVAQLSEDLAEMTAALHKARECRRELEGLVWRGFDGQCPVTHQLCPAANEVREHGKSMAAELDQARDQVNQAEEKQQSAKVMFETTNREQTRREADKIELQRLREKARELLPGDLFIREHGEPPEVEDVRAEVAGLQQRIASDTADKRILTKAMEDLDKWTAEREKVLAELGGWNDKIQTFREAVAILGRNGAQREIAEESLAEVKAGANALLVDAGIDLHLDVQWSREGKKLATACEQCGAPFPTSMRVKMCKTCGAPRGPKMIDNLEIRLSDRSGAAEDIAGLAFQLSAATWLRARRGTDWSTVFVDEPFGALDAANSKALSTHIQTLLRGRYSFRQAFLVAHDDTIMEALPARVQITGKSGGNSTVEVLQ